MQHMPDQIATSYTAKQLCMLVKRRTTAAEAVIKQRVETYAKGKPPRCMLVEATLPQVFKCATYRAISACSAYCGLHRQHCQFNTAASLRVYRSPHLLQITCVMSRVTASAARATTYNPSNTREFIRHEYCTTAAIRTLVETSC